MAHDLGTKLITDRPSTTAQLLWPRRSLAGCIFAAIVRDTRGAELTEQQRFNHFPATPFCTLYWMLEGDCRKIDHVDHFRAPQAAPLMPRFGFLGPQRGSWHLWNPGPSHCLTLVIYPEAFTALTGVELTVRADLVAPATDVLSEAMHVRCRELYETRVDDAMAFWQALEEQLDDWWHQARPISHTGVMPLKDWVNSLVARAAISGVGCGIRQIERRIKSWTGQSARDLNALSGTDRFFVQFWAGRANGGIDWSHLAADAGFSDQSHMTRRLRRDTGFTPGQLGKLIESEEAFWCYRLLGERYWSPKAHLPLP